MLPGVDGTMLWLLALCWLANTASTLLFPCSGRSIFCGRPLEAVILLFFEATIWYPSASIWFLLATDSVEGVPRDTSELLLCEVHDMSEPLTTNCRGL